MTSINFYDRQRLTIIDDLYVFYVKIAFIFPVIYAVHTPINQIDQQFLIILGQS
jgi:hypothetical protein